MNTRKYLSIMQRVEISILTSMSRHYVLEQTIFLVFLHYISYYADLLKIKSIESMKKMFECKRSIDEYKSGKKELSYDEVYNFLKILEDEYNIRSGFLANAADFYERFIKNIKLKYIKLNFDALNELNDENEIREFIKFCFNSSWGITPRLSSENMHSPSIRKLSEKILDISVNDVVMDCNVGIGSLLPDLNPNSKFIGYEFNPTNIHFAYFISIIFGFENFEIVSQNFFAAEVVRANKIYVDNLINIRLSKEERELEFKYGTTESNIILLKKVYESLNRNGKAVLALPSKVLFSESMKYHELRKFISEECLSAVISLPGLWYGTVIDTNLIVLEKDKVDKNVMFINAKSFGNKIKGTYELSEEAIEKIVNIYNEKKSISGISQCVHYLDTICAGTWLPSYYVVEEDKSYKRNLKDIEKELKDLYKSLFQNNND